MDMLYFKQAFHRKACRLMLGGGGAVLKEIQSNTGLLPKLKSYRIEHVFHGEAHEVSAPLKMVFPKKGSLLFQGH